MRVVGREVGASLRRRLGRGRRRVRRFLAVSRGRRMLLFQAFGLLVLVRFGLRLLPYPLLLRRLRGLTGAGSVRLRQQRPLDEIVWAVEAAARRHPGASCLCRALVGEALLLREGHPASVRIGVRRSAEGDFKAHAWVEADGVVVLGDLEQLSDYRTLAPVGVGGGANR